MCSGCMDAQRRTWYCSEKCQIEAWPTHKALCRQVAETQRKLDADKEHQADLKELAKKRQKELKEKHNSG